MKTVVVIPARLQSTRLPNKLLLDLGGISIIQRVYLQCLKAKGPSAVYIAVDTKILQKHCLEFTSNVILTSDTHQSGTDRIAEAAQQINADAIINVQGDEPFIEPDLIDEIHANLEHEMMVSAMCEINNIEELENPNNVKVITDINDKAIYFSRSIIPFNRERIDFKKLTFKKHLGIYGYNKKFLLKFSKMKPTYLETTEKLEQLRVIENGFAIKMIVTDTNSIGIDTQEDYDAALLML